MSSTNQIKLGNEIGRGGFGIVYLVSDKPGLCVKVSKKDNSCRKWSDEYKKIQSIILAINPFLYSDSNAEILKPVKYFEDDFGRCFMVMQYIKRPKEIKGENDTVQPMFGEKDIDIVHHGRGQFIGLEQISKVVKDINKFCYDIGYLMGLIHFIGKNDAYDIELFLGYTSDDILKVYVADFDLSENITSYPESIDRIVWSLQAVPYFPTTDTPELLDTFFTGYKKAANLGNIPDDIVQKIISEYSY